ncbi:unnamed protein product [Auanema sp. JU1783]|nr:unnamed protein product [Auanema sp. JU1783]
MLKVFLFLLLGASCANANGPVQTVNTYSGQIYYTEDWNYSNIRTGAHTFWWLYAAQPANNRPIILWLQGGPGASSTGFGNFEETGPKRMNGSDNMATWLQVADLVYVDNPVGAGFSYVDDESSLTTNVAQIGQDLLSWLKDFISFHPEYTKRPFYIFCESYGGKMSAEFARVITNEVAQKRLTLNFAGVALGDSWISPMDYVNTWGPYLYANSFLDENSLKTVNAQAARCQKDVDQGKWSAATNCWSTMEDLIMVEAGDVSWYNILKKGGQDDWSKKRRKRSTRNYAIQNLYEALVKPMQLDSLSDYMDTIVRQKVGIIPPSVKFGAQSGAVFNAQSGDFMKPVYSTVDLLLKQGTNVIVYNGNEDLICDTWGTNLWIERLTWDGMKSFNTTHRHTFSTASHPLSGFYKVHNNFQYWYVLRAGHMVAYDTPEAAIHLVQSVIKSTSK